MRELLLSRTDAIRVHEAHPRNRLSLPEVPATANESNHKRERLMDDLEATRLCAVASGIRTWNEFGAPFHSTPDGLGRLYDPLHDDAQMAALIKHFRLHIDQRPGKHVTAQDPHFLHLIERPDGQLNAAVVYCVAAMQRAKGAG